MDSRTVRLAKLINEKNTPAAWSSKVAIAIDDEPICNAIEQLSKSVDAPIYRDQNGQLDQTDSLSMSGISGRSALKVLLKHRGLSYSITGSGVRVHRLKE